MEVGKRYRASSVNYECIWMTPSGNAIITCLEDNREYLAWPCHFSLYVEVKKPVVKYVHWFRDIRSGRINTWTNDKPEKDGVAPGGFWEYLKTDRIEYDG